MKSWLPLFLAASAAAAERPAINRESVVRAFNPRRQASSEETPLQVGNGDFAFGVDVTGLQTFNPFASLSTWGWHEFPLPDTPGQSSPEDFKGVEWDTHGRMVEYNQPSTTNADLANWLRENPHRLNLGTIGISFPDPSTTEADLSSKFQVLDLWTGKISSEFTYEEDSKVKVATVAHPDSSTVGISVESKALGRGELGLFFDFPYPTHDKFGAPFVGVFNLTEMHGTELVMGERGAEIRHVLGETEYSLYLKWEGDAKLEGPEKGTHRYFLKSAEKTLRLTATFAEEKPKNMPSFEDVEAASEEWWREYWSNGAFLDLTSSESEEAMEIQRRTILSQYLVAVNSASSLPPQESGLVNNGWYGKFHLEMYLWHSLQFARWDRFSLLNRSLSHLYPSMLDSARARAKNQGYDGARWGKMTGPDLKDAPGEINSLLIWQQPHPMYFAETEYRKTQGSEEESVLTRWDEVITATADFMASFAWWNETTQRYDLGPPMYPVSENTDPKATMNPTFELAYWRFGLDIAILWKERQDLEIPEEWVDVRDNLAPLPVVDGTFPVYEGIPDMWTDNATTMDHPAMTGIYGLLPPPMSGPELNLTVVEKTAEYVLKYWDLDQSFGWDFPMLAMNAVRLGNQDLAVEYLLHSTFQFDDAGYPTGGTRVPTPYFPSSSSFLLAVAMMAGGWDGEEGTHFPSDWEVAAEGFVAGM